jgi:hypothetical protein
MGINARKSMSNRRHMQRDEAVCGSFILFKFNSPFFLAVIPCCWRKCDILEEHITFIFSVILNIIIF